MSPKNNLREHLRWLLNEKPVVPAYITPPPSVVRSPAAAGGVSIGSSSDSFDAYVTANEEETTKPILDSVGKSYEHHKAPIQSLGRVGAVETGVARGLDGSMARLVSAPSSSKKRSLMHNDSEALDALRRKSEKHHDSRHTQPSGMPKDGPATPLSMLSDHSKIEAKLDKEPAWSRSKSAVAPHPPSSSSYEEFGEPQRLWTEKHASQKEPSPSRGRKRKSGEISGKSESNRVISMTQPASKTDRFESLSVKDPDTDEEHAQRNSRFAPFNSKKRRSSHSIAQAAVLNSDDDLARFERELLSAGDDDEVVADSEEERSQVLVKAGTDPISKQLRSLTSAEVPNQPQILDSDEDEEVLSPVNRRVTGEFDRDAVAVESETVNCSQPFSGSKYDKEIIPSDVLKARTRQREPSPSCLPVLASPLHSDSPTKQNSSDKLVVRAPSTVPVTPTQTQETTLQALLSQNPHRLADLARDLDVEMEKLLDSVWKSEEVGETSDHALEEAEVLRDEILAFNNMISLVNEHRALTCKASELQANFKQAFMEKRAVSVRDFRLPEHERARMVEIEQLLDDTVEESQRIARSRLNKILLDDQFDQDSKVSVARTPIKRQTPATQIFVSPPQEPRFMVAQTQSFGEVPSTPRREKSQSMHQANMVHPAQRSRQEAHRSEHRSPLRTMRPTEPTLNGASWYGASQGLQARSTPQKGISAVDAENHMDYDILGSPHRPIDVDAELQGFEFDDDEMADCLADYEEKKRMPPPKITSQMPVATQAGSSDQPKSGTKHKVQSDPFKVDLPSKKLMSYPWSKDVKANLITRFGLKGFRHHQLEAINATLAGKDTFVLMPTGGGKSLCYQLPAIINSGKTQGITIVVSPLLSLMEDQVHHLSKIKVQASLINGEIPAEAKRVLMGALRGADPARFVQLLYVTPEMLSKNKTMIELFKSLNSKGQIARIVVDEAHCVSQWGHDFRPDYQCIGEFRRELAGVPVMALTATATENVKTDVIHNLGMVGHEVFTQSFNRPNLYYEVHKKEKAMTEKIANLIKSRHDRQCGIVYCLSRKNCEKVAEELRTAHRIQAAHYHAGMKPEEKKETQARWQDGTLHVIVATIAFGMGIDKPNVRYVIHHSVPKSLEGYYQETGRAGRDGKQSHCYLYYSFKDVSTLEKMIREDENSSQAQKERQLAMLREVNRFADNAADCRRVQILRYFSEKFTAAECNKTCDNCNSTSSFVRRDFTDLAKAAVEFVRKVAGRDGKENKFTKHQCVDVFRGTKGRNVRTSDAERLEAPHIGIAKDLDRGTVERLFNNLITEGALEEVQVTKGMKFPVAYLGVGRRMNDMLLGRKKLEMDVSTSPQPQLKNKRATKNQRNSADSGQDGIKPGKSRRQPTSTMLSSPVIPRGKETKTGIKASLLTGASSSQINLDESDSEFEAIQDIRKPRPVRRVPQPGPPIMEDPSVASLDEVQKTVLEQAIEGFRKKAREVMDKKSLRKQPFTETQLRQMIIRLPNNQQEMLQIAGMREDMVLNNGHYFMPLIAQTREITCALRDLGGNVADDGGSQYIESEDDEDEAGRVHDKNHEIEVVMIDSDEEAVPAEEYDLDDSMTGQTSQYFDLPPDVAEFNAALSQANPTASRQSKPKYPGKASSRKTAGGKGSRARSKSLSSRSSKSTLRGARGSSKAPSRKVTGHHGRTNTQSSAGTSGIGMMPT